MRREGTIGFRDVILDAIVPARRAVARHASGNPDGFLGQVRGVIHIGANLGQERFRDRRLGLEVLWIEPIPSVFEGLQRNIRVLPGQRAVRALVTDTDGRGHDFHIASNDGASSSIHALKRSLEIWPRVHFVDTMHIESVTLLRRERIDSARSQALVLDTQGSERLVLHGAASLLGGIRFVKVEAYDLELYEGRCRRSDISAYLGSQGSEEIRHTPFAGRAGDGTCYDVVFRRRA